MSKMMLTLNVQGLPPANDEFDIVIENRAPKAYTISYRLHSLNKRRLTFLITQSNPWYSWPSIKPYTTQGFKHG